MPGPAPHNRKLKFSTDNIKAPAKIPKVIKPYFVQIVKRLQNLGLSSPTDVSVVYSLSVQMYRRQTLLDEIVKSGETFTTADGYIKCNPAAKMLNDVVASICRLEDQLGLSPKARKLLNGDSSVEEPLTDINDILDRMDRRAM